MTTQRKNSNVRMHFTTAIYLMEGLKESMAADPNKWESGKYTYESFSPENSDESIIRRCVQIRQELLQVMKGIRNG